MKIEINSRWKGRILFEYSSYDNSKTKTIEKAVSKGADLKDADLKDANLKGANLYKCGLYQVSGIGSAGRTTTYDSNNDKVLCGCFFGSMAEFVTQVENEYGEKTDHGIHYRAAIGFFKAIAATLEPDKEKAEIV